MVNNTILQGRLTADPELKTVGSDISVCEFTVAWSEKYKDKETKCFLRCKAWRGTAEFLANHFVKGKELAVEGNLITEEWTDKESGEKKSRTILNVSKIHFCGSDKGAKTGSEGAADGPRQEGIPEGFQEMETDDEVPF